MGKVHGLLEACAPPGRVSWAWGGGSWGLPGFGNLPWLSETPGLQEQQPRLPSAAILQQSDRVTPCCWVDYHRWSHL